MSKDNNINNTNDLMEVKMWVETIALPTYEVGPPNKNPLFLEKRVYQGGSGKIYPLPFTDTIHDEKVMKDYEVVFIENEYIQVMIMPSMGGKIYRAIDKTNQYDFVYYNQVVKPALVGLIGPWVSGGIEFNWPQHHRPSTFMPVEYKLVENEDGSKTCWVSEIDRMYGTQGMAGFTLYADKAYIEVNGQLFNRTEVPQTFLWWANPAIAVNDYTQSIFPPDVHAVFDHGKRDVSKFPIASGVYYKMDYSEGVDISKYKNIPVPTSYMAYHSDYNFVGGYDFSVDAGILHYANHHISPGKKQWTWGNSDFGQAWDRNLTDEDGPYIELMTGIYTDNQPDFTWLAPKEEKSFKQYFMPYKGIGQVKNSSLEVAINLEENSDGIVLLLYTTSPQKKLIVSLYEDDLLIFEDVIQNIDPKESYAKQVEIPKLKEIHHYRMQVSNEDHKELISYQAKAKEITSTPEPAKAPGLPNEIRTNEELFLIGLHLEQYRHATYQPESYYLEALKRDEGDIRSNNAYGLLMYRRGRFDIARKHFEKAIESMSNKNPNPYDSEAYYNLGLTLKKLGLYEEAYAAFYKSTWNYAWKNPAFYEIACIDSLKGDLVQALYHVEQSIIRNTHNVKARNLKTAILRRLNKSEQAIVWNKETLAIDPISYGALNENLLLKVNDEKELLKFIKDNPHNLIETSNDYGCAGLYEEATTLLKYGLKEDNKTYPMIHYFLGYYTNRMHVERNISTTDFDCGRATEGGKDKEKALTYYTEASKDCPDYCFPNRLDEILVLREAIMLNKKDAKAPYYLGNLYYDKKQFDVAIELWQTSVDIDGSFPTVNRNLALAYVNKKNDVEKALIHLENAFKLESSDARVFFELDQLYKKIGRSYESRLSLHEKHMELVKQRDDLFVEYTMLLNMTKRYEEAMVAIDSRNFHPWEGGEGKVTYQYKRCRIELAKNAILIGDYKKAEKLLEECKVYPTNLGEGKLIGTTENEINYFLGLVYKEDGNHEKAEEFFRTASNGINKPTDAMFYNDQPADMMFYQGLASGMLGDRISSKRNFNKLITYGEEHLRDEIRMDYFAVSLPDFLIFDVDLNEKNRIHCLYLMGLGYLGLNDIKKGTEFLQQAYEANNSHQGVYTHLKLHENLYIREGIKG